jgi:type IV fimbrial biogenesis protein FimT
MERLQRGFNLVEILIVVTIIGILLATGLPSFLVWTQNTQIRAGAESILAGLQIAKNEAIRRNVSTQFILEANTTKTGWTIATYSDCEAFNPIQVRNSDEGSANVTREIAPSETIRASFNGLGRVIPKNCDGTDAITQIDLDNAMIPDPADRRKLRIVIPVGGAVRLCDPLVTATSDPRTCYP